MAWDLQMCLTQLGQTVIKSKDNHFKLREYVHGRKEGDKAPKAKEVKATALQLNWLTEITH